MSSKCQQTTYSKLLGLLFFLSFIRGFLTDCSSPSSPGSPQVFDAQQAGFGHQHAYGERFRVPHEMACGRSCRRNTCTGFTLVDTTQGHMCVHNNQLYDTVNLTVMTGAFYYQRRASFVVSGCGNDCVNTEGISNMTVSYISGYDWGTISFCKAVIDRTLKPDGVSYNFRVDLFNIEEGGHPGVMYNIHSDQDFDFVYFRPHRATYQLGSIRNGVNIRGLEHTGFCTFPGAIWNTVELVVTNQSAEIYVNGGLVVSVPSWKLGISVARAGISLVNGSGENSLEFKDFLIA